MLYFVTFGTLFHCVPLFHCVSFRDFNLKFGILRKRIFLQMAHHTLASHSCVECGSEIACASSTASVSRLVFRVQVVLQVRV